MKIKILIAATFVILTVCTGLGYFLGWSDSREHAYPVIIANMDVRDEADRVFLVYSCSGKEIARYDVDNDSLVSPSVEEKRAIFGGEESFYEKTYKYAAAFFAGGGAPRLVRHFRPALKAINLSAAQKLKYFFAGAVVGTSGVYLGYNLGAKALPKCDDKGILDLLALRILWKPMTALIAKEEWTLAMLEAERTWPEKSQLLADALTQIQKGQVDANLFRFLKSLGTETQKGAEEPSRFAIWLSGDMILFVYLPTLVAVIAGVVVAVRFSTDIVRGGRRKARRADTKRLRS
jgi:hypothetical protein